MREHSVVNLKEHTPINIVAPEDAAALAPEMLLKIARSQSVIDDAINREPRCHQGRLDTILQISGIGSIAHDYETLAVRKSGCAQCNARVAMTIEFPIWRQIIAHVGVAHEPLGRSHVNIFADCSYSHVLTFWNERNVAYVRLLQHEEVNHVMQLLALKFLRHTRFYDAGLPGWRRLVAVEQAIRYLRVDAERSYDEIKFDALAIQETKRWSAFERRRDINILCVLRDVTSTEFDGLI